MRITETLSELPGYRLRQSRKPSVRSGLGLSEKLEVSRIGLSEKLEGSRLGLSKKLEEQLTALRPVPSP